MHEPADNLPGSPENCVIEVPKLRVNGNGGVRQSDAALYLRRSVRTLDRLRKQGLIASYKVGSARFFKLAVLDAYLARMEIIGQDEI